MHGFWLEFGMGSKHGQVFGMDHVCGTLCDDDGRTSMDGCTAMLDTADATLDAARTTAGADAAQPIVALCDWSHRNA